MQLTEIIAELLKFSDRVLHLGPPIEDNRISLFEEKYGLQMPDDFKKFICQYNGIELFSDEVYGFYPDKPLSIESVYYREHFEVAIPLFDYLVPFSPDGGGNFYCFDTRTHLPEGSCPVVFWVSNYLYSKDDMPEIVNASFVDWFKQVMLDWTLNIINFDGTKKNA